MMMLKEPDSGHRGDTVVCVSVALHNGGYRIAVDDSMRDTKGTWNPISFFTHPQLTRDEFTNAALTEGNSRTSD